MSAATNASQDRQPTSPKWTRSKKDQEDLDAIDAAVVRMQKVTRADPYILSIPQDVEPYRHSYKAQIEQWRYYTPFKIDDREDESIQYQTFVYHEPGTDMWELRNNRAEEASTNETADKTRPGTGANTPNGAPKKKISLLDYKKNKSGGTTTPELKGAKGADAPARQPAVKGPIERVKAEDDEILATVAEVESEGTAAVKDTLRPQNELKRKREQETTKPKHEQELKKAEVKVNGDTPAAKKAKTSDVTPSKQQKPDTARRKDETTSRAPVRTKKESQAQETSLPPRLSPLQPPGMPERLSPLQTMVPEEPPAKISSMKILSPTIPGNVAKALEARSSASNSTTKKNDKLTPLKKAEVVTKHKSPVPRNGFRATSSSPAVRSDVEEKGRAKTSAPRAKSPEHSQSDDAATNITVSTKKLKPPAKASLMVKIKYKKARRDDIARILKMRPRPDKSMSAQHALVSSTEAAKAPVKTVGASKLNGEQKDATPAKGVAQKVGPAKKDKIEKKDQRPVQPQEEKRPAAEKRPLPEDTNGESAAKRKKTDQSNTRKAPSTPAQRELDSQFQPKSGPQATPSTRKGLLSTSMQRSQSQDSNGNHATPPELSNTPGNSGQVNGTSNRPPSSQPVKTEAQVAWETEQKRLETMGRDLKRAASSLLNTENSSQRDKKVAAAQTVESLICYLLAFTCADESSLAANPKRPAQHRNWQSLTGLYHLTKRSCLAYAPLRGVTAGLGLSYSSRILAISAERPKDNAHPAIPLEVLQEAIMVQEKAGRLWEDEFPDVKAIETMFPSAWRAHSEKALNSEVLKPSALAGPYKLPILLSTKPYLAARAGYAMLKEWTVKENLQYTFQLELTA
ncbi:hypothetical protein CLAFUW4_03384 [Fulvia fulva]|uniref:Uncharacterized protein n=1 Tax=Passalora fulva TaxID=5499 RepID=A0A9Q8P5Q4_PASFU|nr:uncharacterized protein CLAFUR5_03364 [Fulvia fulva]KAK4632024.1 hypothetical protein CLAFUR4_03373 [Fulvia fulva]KAK4633147.1 hypothetical protein CLAFUR0_03378 [Fulvia fulva]UJO14370.1 hypothetical protein CLAFUR5_03364 [Fulvia fulva]WPV11713.1 hypothetical protein CLAFUW4_03384 [Fulvia fulva]WPV26141.1 hypothetical protein CLAFUW7_03376 [Fulvia fulva]